MSPARQRAAQFCQQCVTTPDLGGQSAKEHRDRQSAGTASSGATIPTPDPAAGLRRSPDPPPERPDPICPDDPEAMLRHTQACRDCAVPFAADPSQQIARMEGVDLRRLVDGARYLFTNEYERELLVRKTGWDAAQLLGRVGAW